jgi:hypothetical protein|eukprot:Opistho-1_new@54170
MTGRGKTAGGMTALGMLLVVGCSTDPGWPKRAPVSGRVLVDGKPAVRAAVKFTPAGPAADGKTYTPATFTDDDGGFKLTTVEAGDGAPPGDYTVTVVATYAVKNGQDVPVPDLLGGRYADPKTSPLKVTVREAPNALEPFDLKSK